MVESSAPCGINWSHSSMILSWQMASSGITKMTSFTYLMFWQAQLVGRLSWALLPLCVDSGLLQVVIKAGKSNFLHGSSGLQEWTFQEAFPEAVSLLETSSEVQNILSNIFYWSCKPLGLAQFQGEWGIDSTFQWGNGMYTHTRSWRNWWWPS